MKKFKFSSIKDSEEFKGLNGDESRFIESDKRKYETYMDRYGVRRVKGTTKDNNNNDDIELNFSINKG